MVTDARYLRHRFDEVFEIDHGKKQSLRDKYRTFHVHEATPSQVADSQAADAQVADVQATDPLVTNPLIANAQFAEQHGPIQVVTTLDGAKLVTVVFSTHLGGEGPDMEQRMLEIRQMLSQLLEPGERCHLFVEDEPVELESAEAEFFVREARGYIAPPDSSEAL
jgi:hypothetical protein